VPSADDPSRFFVPAYVGHKGWLGARLDVSQDWTELTGLIQDSYRLIAPKRLAAYLKDQIHLTLVSDLYQSE
jgi:predicted DNA-binding protein (MmcQ/YjbR family)